MSQSKLILSQTPALSVPLRFFLTAPLFGVAAAMAALLQGDDLFSSRWSPGMLACTHLLVLGYLGMVMQGALLQVVSVLTGGRPPHVRRLGALAQAALTLGTLSLATGFLTASPLAMGGAALLLGLSFAVFIGAVIAGLLRSRARRDAGLGISLALAGLAITVGLGAWLAMGYGWEGIALPRHLTDVHLAWGLLGWGGILLVTVAYEVVPMFQLTPVYPALMTRCLSSVLMAGLILWSGGGLFDAPGLSAVGGSLSAAGLAAFAMLTLWLQTKRKKKQPDATVWFWRCAMSALLAAVLIWAVAAFVPAWRGSPAYGLLLGLLVIYGFLVSVVNGMLYKILPFLTWLHLSIEVTEHKLSRRLVPNVKKIIPDEKARVQFWLHMLTLLLMAGCTWRPAWFLAPLALALAASNVALWLNLYGAVRVFRKTRAGIAAASSGGKTETT